MTYLVTPSGTECGLRAASADVRRLSGVGAAASKSSGSSGGAMKSAPLCTISATTAMMSEKFSEVTFTLTRACSKPGGIATASGL